MNKHVTDFVDDDIDYSDNPEISDIPEEYVAHFVPQFDGHDMDRLMQMLDELRRRKDA